VTHSLDGKILLGIDFGTRVIGLATYAVGRDPFPLMHGKIVVKSEDQVLRELAQIVSDETIDLIVLGLPLFTDGTESTMTQTVKAFATKLQVHCSETPIMLQDETLTTFEAEERMKQSPKFQFKVDPKQIDALSACLIIEDFLKREGFISS